MSKDNNAVLKTGEAADSVAVKGTGENPCNVSRLSQWSSMK